MRLARFNSYVRLMKLKLCTQTMILKTRYLFRLSLAIIGLLAASTVSAAERIAFSYPPFGEFYVLVQDLELFAKEGKITSSFGYYAEKVSPNDLQQLRDLLTRPLPINEVQIYNFLNTPLGTTLIAQLSKIINNPTTQSQPALKGALIGAAQNPEGLTILEVLRKYSLPTINVSLTTIVDSVERADKLLTQTDRFFQWVAQQSASQPAINLSTPMINLTQPGPVTWQEHFLKVKRPLGKPIEVMVYLPNNLTEPAPIVLIAPGFNSNFNSLLYAAKHLTSHGYGVIGINFPETDSQTVSEVLSGFGDIPKANAWLKQSENITTVLDFIDEKLKNNPNWQGKLDINNVGILGHSLGGYTSLAVGGAKIDWSNLLKTCEKLAETNEVILNPALIWQCGTTKSTPPDVNMQDPRIKALIVLSPVTNPIFSPQSISFLKIPTIIIGGSNDIFAPSLSQQVTAFSWLPDADNYLVLLQNGTHLSFIQGTENMPQELVGPQPALAHSYLKALSLAFFNAYLKSEDNFKPYLTASAVSSLSQEPLPIYLMRALTLQQLFEVINFQE